MNISYNQSLCDTQYYCESSCIVNDKNDEYTDFMILSTMLGGSILSYLFWLIVTYFGIQNEKSSYPPLDIKKPYYDRPMRVMGNTNIKMRVILVRHGQSEHNKRHDGKDGEKLPEIPELDTGLTYSGHEQAEQVGCYLNSFNWLPDIIRISPMVRAIQTAEPFMKKYFGVSQLHKPDGNEYMLKTPTGKKSRVIYDEECMEVNTWGDQKLRSCDMITKKETYEEFIERVKMWKKTLENDCITIKRERTQVLVFTHSMVISEFLNLIVAENRENVSDEYWSKIYWQVNHGSITCLDYTTTKEWHVQAMNYSKHIRTHTGIKSPFV